MKTTPPKAPKTFTTYTEKLWKPAQPKEQSHSALIDSFAEIAVNGLGDLMEAGKHCARPQPETGSA